jgi:hypothetical protein
MIEQVFQLCDDGRLQRLPLAWPMKLNHEGRSPPVIGVVPNKYSSNHIFMDIHAKSIGDLLGNLATAETRIAPFHFDDSIDKVF